MPASYSLGRLHSTLNAAMGWSDSHLHMLDVDGRKYSVSDDEIWFDRVAGGVGLNRRALKR